MQNASGTQDVFEPEDEEDQFNDDIFISSESEPEIFEEDLEWQVKIVGEEIKDRNQVVYEVGWPGWERPDRSRNTWATPEQADCDMPEEKQRWDSKMARIRKSLAEKSLDVPVWSGLDLLSESDYLRSEAFEEKLKERKRKPLTLSERMDSLLAKREGRNEMSPSTSSGARRQTRSELNTHRSESVVSDASSHSTLLTSSSSVRPPSSSTSRSTRSEHESSGSPRPRNRGSTSSINSNASTNKTSLADVYNSRAGTSTLSRQAGIPSSSTKTPLASGSSRPSVVTPSPKGKERALPKILLPPRHNRTVPGRPRGLPEQEKMSERWSKSAATESAASIDFVNTVDDEKLPPIADDFQYLESGYDYTHKNISQLINSLDQGVFTRCECRRCTAAHLCDCQQSSEIFDEEYKRRQVFAYSDEGLFLFNVPGGTEVIECNHYCQCELDRCPNRVAQRPRKFPVTIFKTENRGWGVRSNKDIQSGTILGHYSGKLIPRMEAESLEGPDKMYCFDIDGREGLNEDDLSAAYSVDARHCGNWTRYLNHSCSPNVMVYLAVWATIPEMRMPNIVFVALKDIPANTEFAFDYDPLAEPLHSARDRLGIPEGARKCMCGADNCRGYVRV
ncbi:SET domain-containing protein [Dendrothele bispora CBS 962.96]|uniref:SET domain-containing protein n=1 Tax=Dendrothele bispora (strain CBS 962.96) TaxID=1314807 RepID=A0A4S8N0D5_DENBC|nr:SET domain-containing protein [Dendrothele bispora CBS 962.96]